MACKVYVSNAVKKKKSAFLLFGGKFLNSTVTF